MSRCRCPRIRRERTIRSFITKRRLNERACLLRPVGPTIIQSPLLNCRMPHTVTSPVYVCADNIDTDQIIPAQYLTLVPTIAEEYEKLGSYAMIGLPDDLYPTKFVPVGELKTPYQIVI